MFKLEKIINVYYFDTIDEAVKYAEARGWREVTIQRQTVDGRRVYSLEKVGGLNEDKG